MNTKRFCWILLVVLMTGCGMAGSLATARSAPLQDKIGVENQLPFALSDVQIDKLSQHVLWRRLLMLGDGGYAKDKNRIDTETFFLSDDGHTNPKSELIAMLSAIAVNDQKIICRFPARTHFLKTELVKLGVNVVASDADCQEFRTWADKIDARQLSFVFAEEHGNNIASAFAHAFMRIDGDERASDERATVMNYTVASSADDGLIANAIKPLTGRYAGVMEILPYRVKSDDYLVKDERDLWEYRLDLTPSQVDQIMRHLWEVKDLARSYYLTHDNCATEIARLVDVVRADKSLLSMFGMVTTPAQAVQVLDRQGIITNTTYHPSNATKRQAIMTNGNAFDMTAIQPNNNNPVTASPTHRLGMAVSYDERYVDKAGYHVSIRSAYQDALDNPAGVRKFHEVILPSIDLAYQDGKIRLNELTIFRATSLNPANTAKAYLGGQSQKKAWATRMQLGLKQAVDASDEQNDTHLVADIALQKGRSWTLGKPKAQTGDMADMVCYVLGGTGGQIGKVNQGYRMGLKFSAGCIYHQTDRWRMTGEIEVPYWYHKDDAGRSSYVQPELKLGAQYDLSRYHALRATASIQKNHSQNNHAVKFQILRYF
ncbi:MULTISPECIES: DUF4105 domain-containing protein [unclassified Moraxella]|uniref:Lnb N-terminal periplasmic domain-containing protein n=1 Tax=unclassified Moraxella TaxID=2685852 RepID=UPI00359DE582